MIDLFRQSSPSVFTSLLTFPLLMHLTAFNFILLGVSYFTFVSRSTKKKSSLIIFAILFSFIISLSQPTKAADNDAVFCEQYKGVKKIWWDGIELKYNYNPLGKVNMLFVRYIS